MDTSGFHDGYIHDLLDTRRFDGHQDVNRSLQMHSSLIRRLSLEKVMEDPFHYISQDYDVESMPTPKFDDLCFSSAGRDVSKLNRSCSG